MLFWEGWAMLLPGHVSGARTLAPGRAGAPGCSGCDKLQELDTISLRGKSMTFTKIMYLAG